METLMDQMVAGSSIFIYALIAWVCDQLDRPEKRKRL